MCGASSDPMNAYTSIQEVMNLNLFSNVKIIEKLKVNLINGKSTICMISSISGLETHGIPSYSAAKSALIAYTRSVGRYLSSYGVSMFAVSPGAFEGTDQGYWRQLQLENPEAYSNFVKSRMAIGRIGTVEEVSNFIFQMCRCATPYVAGNNFVLDGGQGRGFYG
jgi:3-oxoacyl-[acyl-carrier protein] reductase